MTAIKRSEMLDINQRGWNEVAPQFYGRTALPQYGPLAMTEEELHLIDNLEGKAVLELGCGSGHTLCYLARVKAAGELWGIDLSQTQIHLAQDYLGQEGVHAQLFLASMDENPGIPEAHFDLVVAIYSLGWTPDLSHTLLQNRPGFRLRVGDWRIIYEIQDERMEIIVMRVAPRGEVYR